MVVDCNWPIIFVNYNNIYEKIYQPQQKINYYEMNACAGIDDASSSFRKIMVAEDLHFPNKIGNEKNIWGYKNDNI